MLTSSRLWMRSLWTAVAVVLTGCATQSLDEPEDSTPAPATPTPADIRAQNQRDIEAARKAVEWQAYVCSQSGEERKRLIAETVEKYGWQIACADPSVPRGTH